MGDNERLCAVEPCLRSKRSSPRGGGGGGGGGELELPGSVGQRLTCGATGAPCF